MAQLRGRIRCFHVRLVFTLLTSEGGSIQRLVRLVHGVFSSLASYKHVHNGQARKVTSLAIVVAFVSCSVTSTVFTLALAILTSPRFILLHAHPHHLI